MQQLLLFLFCLFFSLTGTAQKQMVHFKISKPYSLLNFVETASGAQGGFSATLREYIKQHIPENDTAFKNLLRSFSKINLNYAYKRPELPDSRRQNRDIYDLICIAAVQSNTLEEFRQRTAGMLPNSGQMELLDILRKAEIYYDRIIGQDEQPKTAARLKEMEAYQAQYNELFLAFRDFYNSAWSADMPFTVAVYPIPGRSGSSSATPHANSLCVGVLTEEKDHVQRAGVVLHEICHVLYDEQASSFQHCIDSAFQQSKSPYSALAYTFFDEALATALGNGYVYQYITKKTDTTEWYNNKYINGYAHALYPLVTQYLSAHKAMDHAFVEDAIAVFARTFPRSVADYAVLVNNVQLYSNAATKEEMNDMVNTLFQYFQLSHFNLSSPVTDEQSLDHIRHTKETQLIILGKDQQQSIKALSKIFPAIPGYLKNKKDKNYILSFFDSNKRPVVLIHTEHPAGLDKALKTLCAQQYIEEDKPYLKLD